MVSSNHSQALLTYQESHLFLRPLQFRMHISPEFQLPPEPTVAQDNTELPHQLSEQDYSPVLHRMLFHNR